MNHTMLGLLLPCFFIILMMKNCICGFDIKSSRTFCVQKVKEEYELAPAENGDRIELQCDLCLVNLTVRNNASGIKIGESRLWYRSDVQNRSQWQEATLGMLEPLTDNRVYVDIALQSLVIQGFTPEDSGLYRCRNLAGSQFAYYFLDGIVANDVPLISGDERAWYDFAAKNLNPLGELLTKIAKSDIPTVTMLRTPWSQCESCDITGMGRRSSIARCSVVAPVSLKLLPYNLTSISCASHLQNISQTLLQVPDFQLKSSCECDNEFNFTATKDIINHEIKEGEKLDLLCPGTSKFTHVEWKKGKDVVQRSNWTTLGKVARMRVDTTNVLRIEHAERQVAGQFSCLVEGQTVARYVVHVTTAFVLASDEYQEYRLYLLSVLAICLLLYCIYIGLLYREPRQTRDKITGAAKIV